MSASCPYVDVADVELFGRVATLKVAAGIDVIVPDDPGDYVGG